MTVHVGEIHTELSGVRERWCAVKDDDPVRAGEREETIPPTEPFRLADPMDPADTKNRTVTLTLPDLRRLAARAGEPQGPGGVRVVTPPDSQLMVNPLKGHSRVRCRQGGRGRGDLHLRVRTVLPRGVLPVPDVPADRRAGLPAVVDAGAALRHPAEHRLRRHRRLHHHRQGDRRHGPGRHLPGRVQPRSRRSDTRLGRVAFGREDARRRHGL